MTAAAGRKARNGAKAALLRFPRRYFRRILT